MKVPNTIKENTIFGTLGLLFLQNISSFNKRYKLRALTTFKLEGEVTSLSKC